VTKIFEILNRDAAARIGKLSLENEISTPAIIRPYEPESLIIDSGSLWGNVRKTDLGKDKLVIAPHKSYPLHIRGEMISEIPDVEYEAAAWIKDLDHTGIVVHPRSRVFPRADMLVLGAAKQLENNAREFVNDIIRLKENTRADSLLYVPSLAKPDNLSMLVYMGVDLMDDMLPVIKGYQDIYLTNSGEFHLDRLHEFPCTCPVCSSITPHELLKFPKKERAEALSKHNSLKLGEELRIVRENIRNGQLREYIERQCRARPWLTAALRLIDAETTFLEKRTPIHRQGTFYANTSESLNRVEIRRFAARVLERYTPPDLDTLVLLPCSAKKPYSISLSHQKFINSLGKYLTYGSRPART
jgi:archaeosine synthase